MGGTRRGSAPAADEELDARTGVRSGGLLVLAVGVAVLVPKLVVAWRTFGTNDVAYWIEFARGVQRVGPVHVYGVSFPDTIYNHGPVTSYLLAAFNGLRDFGMPIRFSLRATSSMCDVVSALLVYALVSKRTTERRAVLAGIATAASPVLLLVSGFHGNTDPVFATLMLAACWLVIDRQKYATGGGVLALSVGVKLVPIVLLPVLLAVARRRGRTPPARLTVAFAVVSAALWLPILVLEPAGGMHHVLAYGGIWLHQWGLVQLTAVVSGTSADFLAGPGRFLVLAVAAGLPAWLVLREPDRGLEGAAAAMCGFLLLSPAFSVQYLVWPIALALATELIAGMALNIVAGAWLLWVYADWSGGHAWDEAIGTPLTPAQVLAGFLVWDCLLVVVVTLCLRLRAPDEPVPPVGAASSDCSTARSPGASLQEGSDDAGAR